MNLAYPDGALTRHGQAGRAPDRTMVLPVNHVTATYDPAVHEALLEWTGG